MNCHRYAFQVQAHWTCTSRNSKKLPNVGFGGMGLNKSCDIAEFEAVFGKTWPTLKLNRKHHSSFKPEAEIYIMLLFVLFALTFCPANISAKRKLPQIPSLTHSTLLIANLRLPSSVEILEGLQLHACKLSSFGPSHAIFTERSNGFKWHSKPTLYPKNSCLFRSRDERVETCWKNWVWNNGKSMKVHGFTKFKTSCSFSFSFAAAAPHAASAASAAAAAAAALTTPGFTTAASASAVTTRPAKWIKVSAAEFPDFCRFTCPPVFQKGPGAPSPMLVAMLAVSRSGRWFTWEGI